MDHVWFTRSSHVEERGFHRLASVGGAAVNTCVHVTVWTCSHWWQHFGWRRVTLQLTPEVLGQVHIFITLGKQK